MRLGGGAMPASNSFNHQTYPTTPTVPPVFLKLTAIPGQSEQCPELHASLGIRRVYVVHGTFLGNDPLGLSEVLREIGRSVPFASSAANTIASVIEERTRAIAGSLPTELGNYSADFRDLFQSLTGPDPVVELVTWSSQNHHVARADLAVRLAVELLKRNFDNDERILLWGHSHAGNAFALLTNLLANQKDAVTKFFDAARGQMDAHWKELRSLLAAAPTPHPIAKNILIAAFGTPVRYGWDLSGCRGLVHVLHHREYSPDTPTLTQPLYPPHKLLDVLNARFGDWVQAFAIAGTDVSTPVATGTNEALDQLLTEGLVSPELTAELKFIGSNRIQKLCGWWKTGTRCHQDGINVLVEYEPSGRLTALGKPIEHSLLGHGVATSLHWLPAHLRLVTDQFLKTITRI